MSKKQCLKNKRHPYYLSPREGTLSSTSILQVTRCVGLPMIRKGKSNTTWSFHMWICDNCNCVKFRFPQTLILQWASIICIWDLNKINRSSILTISLVTDPSCGCPCQQVSSCTGSINVTPSLNFCQEQRYIFPWLINIPT